MSRVSRYDINREARDNQATDINRATHKNTTKKMIQKYGKESYNQFMNQRSKKDARKARLATTAVVAAATAYKLNKAGTTPMSVATKAAYNVGKFQGKAAGKKAIANGLTMRELEKFYKRRL